MPIYDLTCETCQKRDEYLVLRHTDPLPQCPDCKGDLKKELTAPTKHSSWTNWQVGLNVQRKR